VNRGTPASLPTQKIAFKNKVIFGANGGSGVGTELWITDGSAAGTRLLKDINAGSSSSYPNYFIEYKGDVYFSATSYATGTELWRTDGTENGTVLFKDFFIGSGSGAPANLAIFNDKLLFRASTDATGNEPWISDGTLQGTFQLAEINPSPAANAHSNMTRPVLYNGKAYFAASTPTYGNELWVTDGTAIGTKLLKDISIGTASSTPLLLTVAGNYLFFRATDGNMDTELWRTNGTDTGTFRLKDIGIWNGNPSHLLAFNNKLYFNATDSLGAELWVSDGSEAGTQRVKDINPGVAHGGPMYLTTFENHFYFNASTSAHGAELWKSDGTESGTVMVKNIHPTSGSYPTALETYGKKLYFNAWDGAHGFELWETDGSEANTQLTCDIYTGSLNGSPSNLQSMAGALYMSAQNDTSGTELFNYTTALGVNIREVSVQTFVLEAKPSLVLDEFFIEIFCERPFQNARLTLTNLYGQRFFERELVLNQGAQVEKYNLGSLPNGVYFITLITGNEFKTIKIVKT
jgi:ELWxxDGT repeat protein